MKASTLYHKDVFLPSSVRALPARAYSPSITRHATEAALSDRYGKITIPASLTFSGREVVECEICEGSVRKLVVRLPYDGARDAVYVIGFDSGKCFLKSVWLNLSNDCHCTLDRSRYETK